MILVPVFWISDAYWYVVFSILGNINNNWTFVHQSSGNLPAVTFEKLKNIFV